MNQSIKLNSNSNSSTSSNTIVSENSNINENSIYSNEKSNGNENSNTNENSIYSNEKLNENENSIYSNENSNENENSVPIISNTYESYNTSKYISLYNNIYNTFRSIKQINVIEEYDTCIYKYTYNKTRIYILLSYHVNTIQIKIPKNITIIGEDCLGVTIYNDNIPPDIGVINQYNCYNYKTIMPYFEMLYSFLIKFKYYDDITILDASKKNNVRTLPIRLLMNQGSIYSRFGFNFKYKDTNDIIIKKIKRFKLPYSNYTIDYYVNNFFNPKDTYNINTVLLYKYIKYYIVKKYDYDNIINSYIKILKSYITDLIQTNTINDEYIAYLNKHITLLKNLILNITKLKDEIKNITIFNEKTKSKINITTNKQLTNITNSTKLIVINKINININIYLDNNIFYLLKQKLKILKYLSFYNDLKNDVLELIEPYINGSLYIDGHLQCNNIKNSYTKMILFS